MAAPEPADLALDAALLMGPDQPRAAEERVETVMRFQRGETFGLEPVTALQHPHHGRGQVVIAHPARDRPEMLERQHMPFQERFLGLGAERHVKGAPRTRQPQHEHPHLHQRARDPRLELPEIDFCFSTCGMRLRHRHLHTVQTQLDPAPRDVAGHRRLRQHRAVLGDQTLPHPPRGMPLLARRVLIGQQPAVDHRRPLTQRRLRPCHIRLSRQRHRIAQRLTHRAPMHLMPHRQRPRRQLLHPTITPDLLEQLHLGPHSPDPQRRSKHTDAKIETGVGPKFVPTRRPTRKNTDTHPAAHGAKTHAENRASRGQIR